MNEEITEYIDGIAEQLLEVSHEIHAHPELAFEEHKASELLASTAEGSGLDVQRGVYGLDTAFESRFSGGGGDGPNLAVLAEYDALPGIGHSCGHNLIATSALGALVTMEI